jgi:hypothetical protein
LHYRRPSWSLRRLRDIALPLRRRAHMLTDRAVLIVEDNVYLSVDLSAAVEEMRELLSGLSAL